MERSDQMFEEELAAEEERALELFRKIPAMEAEALIDRLEARYPSPHTEPPGRVSLPLFDRLESAATPQETAPREE